MIYTIKGSLATLNQHDGANRRNRFLGAKLKHEMTEFVALQLISKPKITKPCMITFNWKVSTRADFDNIRFAAKYVLDGMVKAGVLVDDSQKWVVGFGGDYFTKVPKGQEEIIIDIEEAESE